MCFKYSLLMGRGFGDIMSIKTFDSLSRRRKERSKRSHRKSPTSGRRVHKFRYREDASHSSSRRRHRDRAKDERDSGRNTRRSHSKIPCYIKMRELPAPKKIDFVDDLVWLCSVRFSQYTADWIVDEYFVDHDDDYLVSVAMIFHCICLSSIFDIGAARAICLGL
uniref:Uncharacterized protein n=1 Tax=Glossina austeni TaxID=7395 RepID=A0A1A9UQ90_GLOAU